MLSALHEGVVREVLSGTTGTIATIVATCTATMTIEASRVLQR